MALKITPRAMWRSLVQRFGNPGHAAESPGGAGDAGFWNAWWDQRLAEGLGAPFPCFPAPLDLHLLVNTDDALVTVMAKYGLATVLCAGNGVSQEPRALAAAGFEVTALDISPVAVRAAESFPVDQPSLDRFCSPELQRPGGRVEFVVGDLFDTTVCPGPYDVIVERLTIQRFDEAERAAALAALSARLGRVGIFLSHCLDDGFPAELGWSFHESGMFHASESWFREQGWTIWDGPPGSALEGRVAWLIRCGSMKPRPGARGERPADPGAGA